MSNLNDNSFEGLYTNNLDHKSGRLKSSPVSVRCQVGTVSLKFVMVTYLSAVSRGHSVATVRYGYVFMRGFTWAQCHYSSLRLRIYPRFHVDTVSLQFVTVTYLCAVLRGHSVTTVRYGYVFMRGFTWAQCHYSSLRLRIYARFHVGTVSLQFVMVTYLCAVSRGHSVTTVRYGYVFMRGFTWAQCHYSSLWLRIYARFHVGAVSLQFVTVTYLCDPACHHDSTNNSSR